MVFSVAGRSAIVWIPLSIAAVIFGLRMFVRIRMRMTGLEDYLISVCCLFAIPVAALSQAHLKASSDQIAGVYQYAALLLGIVSLSAGKSSITVVLIRLLDRTARWRRQYLILTLSIFVILSAMCFVINIIPSCEIQKSPTVSPVCLHYAGGIQGGIVFVWSIFGAILDASYSVVAWTVIYTAQLSKEKKIGLYCLFGLGWFAAPFSILRPIATTLVIGSQDIFWLSTALELSLVIIGASVSYLVPLIHYVFRGKPIRPRNQYMQPASENSRRSYRTPVSRYNSKHMSSMRSTTVQSAYGTITAVEDCELAELTPAKMKQSTASSVWNGRSILRLDNEASVDGTIEDKSPRVSSHGS